MSSTSQKQLNLLTGELRRMADPKKAAILQKFFKTGRGQYGQGDRFFGITVPRLRRLAKSHTELPLKDIGRLLASPFHESRMTGLLILVARHSKASRAEQVKISKFYLAHAERINNWDLIDLTAPKILGTYLANRPGKEMDKMARSKNFWKRRMALLSTYHFILGGNPEPTLRLAGMLLQERHDLVLKAAGWMLREAGKRCSLKSLTDFLDRHAHAMPRTMLRYSIERLPEKQRKHYLSL